MKYYNPRRTFLKNIGLAGIPLMLPAASWSSLSPGHVKNAGTLNQAHMVNFSMDGLFYSPSGYLQKLQQIDDRNLIQEDVYFEGGVTSELEKRMAEITGKEMAVYLPSGTMANQVAVKLLSNDTSKVLVPDNSHIFRDEADAAQRVHHKRLIPYGGGTEDHVAGLVDLQLAEQRTLKGEVFQSGLQTVVVECPVRRANGKVVPYNQLRDLSDYCRRKGYKLHLDGARLHLASVYTGIAVAEYAKLFDTVYLSLYKYLNAGGGAVLCGDADLIENVKDQIKVLGGTMWQSWYNTAMALHFLEGFEDRWEALRMKHDSFIKDLNAIEGLKIHEVEDGTNVYRLEVGSPEKAALLVKNLAADNQIYLRSPDESGNIWLYLNESTADIPNNILFDYFRKALIK